MAICAICNKSEVEDLGDGWSSVCESCQNEQMRNLSNKDDKPREKIEREPEISSSLVSAFKIFAEKLKMKPEIVYYPSCDVDISPISGFPDSEVLFVDINPEAVGVLKKHNLHAEIGDANVFKLDKLADVVLLFNPAVDPYGPTQNIKIGGYVLCNNWHKTATKMSGLKDFKAIGFISLSENGESQFTAGDYTRGYIDDVSVFQKTQDNKAK